MQVSVAPLLGGGTCGNPRLAAEGNKTDRGKQPTQKMLNMKSDPEMCMKTKDKMTVCPRQKATFLPGCTSFYTKAPVFCGNHRRFCHFSSTGERSFARIKKTLACH